MTQLEFVKKEIHNIPELKFIKFRYVAGEGMISFLGKIENSARFAREEPLIIGFAFLQLCIVLLGYLIWTFSFYGVQERYSDNSILNLLGAVYILCIVGVVTLPMGILTGAMAVALFMKKHRMEPTFIRCLQISFVRYKPLWIYSWIDGLTTIEMIADRIPKSEDEHERTTFESRAVREFLYFAWKVVTIGIYPSIINGRDIVEAAKESLSLVRYKFNEIVLLRAGYSALCWFVGIVIYLTSYWWFHSNALFMGSLYSFVLSSTVPVGVACIFVLLFLRPIFILSSCEIYSEFVKVEKAPLFVQVSYSIVYKILTTLFVVIILALTSLLLIQLYLKNL